MKKIELRLRAIPPVRAFQLIIITLMLLSGITLSMLYIFVNMLMTMDGRVIVQELNRDILTFEVIFLSTIMLYCIWLTIWLARRRVKKTENGKL